MDAVYSLSTLLSDSLTVTTNLIAHAEAYLGLIMNNTALLWAFIASISMLGLKIITRFF